MTTATLDIVCAAKVTFVLQFAHLLVYIKKVAASCAVQSPFSVQHCRR